MGSKENRFAVVTGVKNSQAIIEKIKDLSTDEERRNFMTDNYFKIEYDENTGVITLIDVTTKDDPKGHTFKFNK